MPICVPILSIKVTTYILHLHPPVRIQAVWRGYKVRKWYKDYTSRNPPKDPALRTKYFEKKVCSLVTRPIASSINTPQSETLISELLRNNISKIF